MSQWSSATLKKTLNQIPISNFLILIYTHSHLHNIDTDMHVCGKYGGVALECDVQVGSTVTDSNNVIRSQTRDH